MDLRTRFSMEVRLSPSMVLGSRLLQLSQAALEDVVAAELAENPALEPVNGCFPLVPVISGARLNLDSQSNFVAHPSPMEQLETQLGLLCSGRDRDIALYLLHSLDEHGHLCATIQELAAELGVPAPTVEKSLAFLHALEPAGLGARNLQECLNLQCLSLAREGAACSIAQRLIIEAWELLSLGRWAEAAALLKLSPEEIDTARRFIARNLHPYPLELLASQGWEHDSFSWFDVEIRRDSDNPACGYCVEVPAASFLELRISESFRQPAHLTNQDRDAEWINARVQRARQFLYALGQRWEVLRKIGDYLVDSQKGFLNRSDRVHPITRRALANRLGLHESTVGRAVAGKTVLLPGGRIIPLETFFELARPTMDAIESILIKAHARKSDREIVRCLEAEGISIARRTVAKYRRQLSLMRKAS